MNTPMIPRQVTILQTANYGLTHQRVSYIRKYDEAMRSAGFSYLVVVPAETAHRLTDALGKGYTDEGRGPFWPSFSSMNAGGEDLKAVWFTQAGLECLQIQLVGEYIFTVEPLSDKLISSREAFL